MCKIKITQLLFLGFLVGLIFSCKKGDNVAHSQPLLIKGQVKYPMINFFYDATPVEGVRIEFYECSANESEDYYAQHTTRDLPIDRWTKIGEALSDTNGFYQFSLNIRDDMYYGYLLFKDGHNKRTNPSQKWSKFSLLYLDTTFYHQNLGIIPFTWIKLNLKNLEYNQDSLTLYPLNYKNRFNGKREVFENVRDTLFFSAYTDTTLFIQTLQLHPEENLQGEQGNFTLWRIKNEKGTEWFAHNSNYQTPTDTMEYTIKF